MGKTEIFYWEGGVPQKDYVKRGNWVEAAD
jgi:hypothetical protein